MVTSAPSKQVEIKTVSHGTPILSWRAPEYEYFEKSRTWRLLAIIAVVGFILYGIVADSYPFAIVIMLFAGVYFLTHKAPGEVEIRITDMGVQIGNRFYEYSHIRHFWLIFKPGEVENLNLRLTKEVIKEISILLGEQDPAEVRAVLSRFIPEAVGKDENFADWIIRKLKL